LRPSFTPRTTARARPTLVAGSQLATMALCATLKSVTNHYNYPEWLGWAASAGGFPAMAGKVPFLMKDVVLFAASVYLLKRDVVRVSLSAKH
jgi:uncharacterized membrane protein YkgB